MLLPNINISRSREVANIEHLMMLAESENEEVTKDLFEYRASEPPSKAAIAAAMKGNFSAYLDAKGMSDGADARLSRWDKKFMELQMKSVAKSYAKQKPKVSDPVAAPNRSSRGKPAKPLPKPKKKSSGRGRGFGYMSLNKALKSLAGGPRSTKARLERAVGDRLYTWIMAEIGKSKPVRLGKRGKALKKRGAITAKSAEQIGGKFFGKMSKAYPFSDKSGKAPEGRDQRIMNKARFIRGLSLAYQLLASNVGKAGKADAKLWLGAKKKKLRMFEWTLLRDLEYLGEEVYSTFMSLVQDCEQELEEDTR